MEMEKIRKERDALNDENRRLKQLLNEGDSAGPQSGGNIKNLKNKVKIYINKY